MTNRMDEVDRVANRVSLAAIAGLISGASYATYRGAPVLRTAMSVAGSCALLGTACFGTERLANVALKQVIPHDDKKKRDRLFFTSHAIGGLAGGGIAGGLFHRHPVPGMLLFAPVMLTVAWAELQFEEERVKRIQRAIEEREAALEDYGVDSND